MSNESAVAKMSSSTIPTGHELPKIDATGTLLWAAAVAAVVVLCCVAGNSILVRLLKPAAERSVTPLHGKGLVLPAQPRLEGIEMMAAAQPNVEPVITNRMNTYGWVDREKRIVHIPIRRAMEMVIARGLLPSAQPAEPRAPEPKPDRTNPQPTTPAAP